MNYGMERYVQDDVSSNSPVLTEEMLLRSYSTNGNRFPTHLLTRLGSQVYDVPPAGQFDLNTNQRRTASTTTTTTHYFTINQNEPNYEHSTSEVIATAPHYPQERFIQIRESDARRISRDYNNYSNRREQDDE